MVLCLGMGAWFLYDGFVLYPHQRDIYNEFSRFEQENRQSDWPAYAREHGYPDGTQGRPGRDHSVTDLIFQQGMGILLAPMGLVLLYQFLSSFSRYVATDDSGVSTGPGRHVPFAAITTVNKRLWDRKGVAYINYDNAGSKGHITLDDWKFDRKAIHQILRDVESHLRPEQIEGGPPMPAKVDPNAAPPASTST
ncbi:MAG: hypothetical protein NTW19_07210 [Planctomycetota bacterium]|nr:hypothetical protein [Planctomycetota bacterium]